MAAYSDERLRRRHRRAGELFGNRTGSQLDRLLLDTARRVVDVLADRQSVEPAVLELRVALSGELPKVLRPRLTEASLRWGMAVVPMLQALQRELREQRQAQEPEEVLDMLLRARIARNVSRQIAGTVGGFVSRTVGMVAPILTQSVAEGINVDTTMRALRRGGLSRYRAYRIARTEIIAAMNQTSHASMERIVPGLNKKWLSSRDARVRKTHLKADGQIVPQQGFFVVGSFRLRWPGDRGLGAAPEETIQCRCTLGAAPVR